MEVLGSGSIKKVTGLFPHRCLRASRFSSKKFFWKGENRLLQSELEALLCKLTFTFPSRLAKNPANAISRSSRAELKFQIRNIFGLFDFVDFYPTWGCNPVWPRGICINFFPSIAVETITSVGRSVCYTHFFQKWLYLLIRNDVEWLEL